MMTEQQAQQIIYQQSVIIDLLIRQQGLDVRHLGSQGYYIMPNQIGVDPIERLGDEPVPVSQKRPWYRYEMPLSDGSKATIGCSELISTLKARGD